MGMTPPARHPPDIYLTLSATLSSKLAHATLGVLIPVPAIGGASFEVVGGPNMQDLLI